MLSGCLLFAVVVVAVRAGLGYPHADPPMVGYVGVAVALLTGAAYLFVPGVILDGWRRRVARSPDAPSTEPPPHGWQAFREAAERMATTRSGGDPYWAMLVTDFSIGAGLLEGTLFLQLVAYMIEGWPWSLVLAAFFGVGLLLKFPTRDWMGRYLQMQRDLVDHVRMRELAK
jgi:hypothetical protein